MKLALLARIPFCTRRASRSLLHRAMKCWVSKTRYTKRVSREACHGLGHLQLATVLEHILFLHVIVQELNVRRDVQLTCRRCVRNLCININDF